MQEHIFNVDHWAWKSLEDFVAYKGMHEFVNNQYAMDAHKRSMNYLVFHPNLHPAGTDTELRDHVETSIKDSLFHFASQTIVSLCTTYEVAAKQFFKCLFVKHPMSMHDFIGEEHQRGTLKLKDIVDANSYERVIGAAAEKAASAATKGKYGVTLYRAAKLSKEHPDDELAKRIDSLQSLRNRIVHEKHITLLGIDDVRESQNIISKAIEMLGYFGLKKDIPGKYTCIRSDVTMVVNSIAMVKME